MELLERGPALAALHSALDAALGGAGRVAAVSGEAGIGKDEPRRGVHAPAAAGRARVLTGACDDLLDTPALGPLHDIAHRLGDRPGGCSTRAAQEPLRRGHRERCAPRPTVLVVEDVHWADEATLDWLAHLGRRLAELPVLLVLTFREDDPESTTSIARVLATLPRQARGAACRWPRSRRNAASSRPAERGRDSAEVYALTGGSPLLVTELLRPTGGGAERARPPSGSRCWGGSPPDAPTGRPAIEVVALVPGICEWWLVEGAAAGEPRRRRGRDAAPACSSPRRPGCGSGTS